LTDLTDECHRLVSTLLCGRLAHDALPIVSNITLYSAR
jgi:hypothetical protein